MDNDFIKKVLECSKDKKGLIEKTKKILSYSYMVEYYKAYGSKNRLIYDFVEYAIDNNFIYENDSMWCSLIKSYVKKNTGGDVDTVHVEIGLGLKKVFDSCVRYIEDNNMTIRPYEANRLLTLIDDSISGVRKSRLTFWKFVVLCNMVSDGISFSRAFDYFDNNYEEICFLAKKEEMASPGFKKNS